MEKIIAMPEWKETPAWLEKKFFEDRGFKVKINLPHEDEEKSIAKLQDVDGIIVGLAKVTRNVIKSCPRLKVIAKQGIGVDNIDVDAATEEGVVVLNVPYIYAEPVANFTILLMLALTRNLLDANRLMRTGDWSKKRTLAGVSLKNKTLGIVGLGNIGTVVAKKCRSAFKMKIMAYDPYITDEKAAQGKATRVHTLNELLRESDIVTLHVPLTSETRHMIGEKELKLMKETAFLINTSRGAVVDEEALIKALEAKKIAGAAVDVYSKEPPDPDFPLLKLSNVILTPHIASSTVEANFQVLEAVFENVCNVIEGRMPEFPSNLVNKGVVANARAFRRN